MFDISLGQHQYKIAAMSAEDGSFLAFKLLNRLRQVMSEMKDDETPAETEKKIPKDEAIRGTLSLILMNLDEDTYKMVQRKALALVSLKTVVGSVEAELPVFQSGKIAVPHLKTDTAAVIELTLECLYHNLSPFFSENGLKLVMTGKA